MSGPLLCGPTNALSSLQKHATSDRTLQQDRLHAQAGPSIPQGFRSSHTPNLSHEFDSFASGPSDFLHAPPPQFAGGIPSWAAEFQQLRISHAPQPSLQHTIPRGTWAASAPAAATSWHAEFLSTVSQQNTVGISTEQQFLHHQQQQHLLQQQHLQQQQQQQQSIGPAIRTHSPSAHDSPNYFHDTPDTFYPHFHDPSQLYWPPPSSLAQQEATDAAFALAFDEAQRWTLEASQHDVLDSISQSQSQPNPTTLHNGKETVEDADELSRTAGQLLESLATEKSQKFIESNFLKLMRQLRDKEVKVEGGEMVEVGAAN